MQQSKESNNALRLVTGYDNLPERIRQPWLENGRKYKTYQFTIADADASALLRSNGSAARPTARG